MKSIQLGFFVYLQELSDLKHENVVALMDCKVNIGLPSLYLIYYSCIYFLYKAGNGSLSQLK